MRYFLKYHEIVLNRLEILWNFYFQVQFRRPQKWRDQRAVSPNNYFCEFCASLWFPLCSETIFWRKKLKKNHWRQKTSEFIFVWKKNCYEFALHQDLPSQSLAQELPKKELQRKKKFQKSYIIWRRFKFWVKLSTTDLSLKCRREKEIEPTGIGTRTRKNRRILCWNLSIMLKMCLKKSGWKFSSIAIKSAWIIWKWLVLHSTISLIPMQLNMVFHQLSIAYIFIFSNYITSQFNYKILPKNTFHTFPQII